MAADLKPVAWRYRRDADMSWALCQSEVIAADWSKHGWDVEPLYAAVPAPLASAGTADFASSEMVAGPQGPRPECPPIGGAAGMMDALANDKRLTSVRQRLSLHDLVTIVEVLTGERRGPMTPEQVQAAIDGLTFGNPGPAANARTRHAAAAEGVDERARFEEWCASYYAIDRGRWFNDFDRLEDGSYKWSFTQDKWDLWQAARASHRPRSGSSVAVASSGNATQCPTLGGGS